MKRVWLVLLAAAAAAAVTMVAVNGDMTRKESTKESEVIMALPKVVIKAKGQLSVEEALQKRRSRRDFADKPLTLAQLGQLLWAAQGQTHK